MKSIVLCIILLLTGYNLYSQIPSTPDGNIWYTDNSVQTITVDGDYTYIGGSFKYVGPNTGYGVKVTTASPVPNSSFPKVEGTVNCVISDGSGGWYIGGQLTKVGTDAGHNLVHITSAGSVDNSWNAGAAGSGGAIFSIVIYNGYLYLAGGFTDVNGVSGFNHLARINIATGIVDASWAPDPGGPIFAMAVNSTGQLYISGLNITSYEPNMAKINIATGTIDGSWAPDIPDNDVNCLAVNGSDEVFIGGMFTHLGSTPVNSLAKLDPANGALISSWNPGPDKNVENIIPNGSYLYICGNFNNIGGEAIPYLARINSSDGTADAGWKPAPNLDVATVAIDDDGNVYAGGTFSSIGGKARNCIAKLNGTDGKADDSWNSNANNGVSTIAVDGSNIYIGGSFTSFGGQTRIGIAKLDNSTGALVTGWKADLDDGPSVVTTIVVNGGYVYIGGVFSSIGGSTKQNLARVDINTGNVDASWAPDADKTVLTMLKDGTDIYVGGNFQNIFSQSDKQYLVKIDADGNLVTGWSPSPDNYVTALALDGSHLYVSGVFSSIDEQSRSCLAMLDKTTGHLITSWTAVTGSSCPFLAVNGSYVYLAGDFNDINGNESYSRLGRVDKTDGTLDAAWHPAPDNYVTSLAFNGSDIYVGGNFANIGGQSFIYIAKVNNTDGTADASWNPVLSSWVNSLVIAGGALLAGGNFSTINDIAPGYFAAFTNSGTLPVELSSFTANSIDKGVQLNWTTATEQNNYGFEVERNTPLNPLSRGDNAANPLSRGDERGVWEKVGFVHGAGNSNSPKEYSFVDSNPCAQTSGTVQYRLKQIDNDGNYKYYSQTAEVNFSMTDVKENLIPKEFGLSQNYPNPFNPSTTISYSIPENPLLRGDERGVLVTLKVYDMLGNEVSTLVNETKAPGYYSVTFNAGNLSTGVYIYRITAGNFTSTKKLMLVK